MLEYEAEGVPFHRDWEGPGDFLYSYQANCTREMIQFVGYADERSGESEELSLGWFVGLNGVLTSDLRSGDDGPYINPSFM